MKKTPEGGTFPCHTKAMAFLIWAIQTKYTTESISYRYCYIATKCM